MSDINNNDPVLYVVSRKGTYDDPFKEKSEYIQIRNGKVLLSEIPQPQERVTITSDDNSLWFEIQDGYPVDNQYLVDYNTGLIYFHESNEAKTLKFSYSGTGFALVNANRVYYSLSNDDIPQTLQELIDNNRSLGNLAHRKSPVSTYANLATTYPTPSIGDMVQTLDDNKEYLYIDNHWCWVRSYPISQIMENKNNIEILFNDVNEINQSIAATNQNVTDLSNSTTTRFNEMSTDIELKRKTLQGEIDDANTKINKNIDDISTINTKLGHMTINVKDLGALGNGVYDDTQYIQQALAMAKDLGGITVEIPPGTYRLTGKLIIYSNTYIKMSPFTRLLRGSSWGFFQNGENGVQYTLDTGQKNIIIEGGILDNNYNNFSAATVCLGLAKGTDITIRNVTFLNVVQYHAIDMNDCHRVLVDNCKFLGFKSGSDDFHNKYTEAIQISNHTSGGWGSFGTADGKACSDVVIRNCFFGKSDDLPTHPCGVGTHEAVPDQFCENIIVDGCTFDGNTYYGVRFHKFRNCKVVNNTFRNVTKGIGITTVEPNDSSAGGTGLAQAGRHYIISHNVFDNIDADCINIRGYIDDSQSQRVEHVIISENIIRTQKGKDGMSAISLKAVDNVRVSNNLLTYVHRGIWHQNCTNLDMNNNKIYDAALEGIYAEPESVSNASRYFNITYNTVMNTGRTGIFIRGGNNFKVIGNTVYDANLANDETARSAIKVSDSAEIGIVAQNTIRGTAINNAITISATSYDVRESDNYIPIDKTNSVAGDYCFSGIYMNTPDGIRRRVTLNSSRQIEVDG